MVESTTIASNSNYQEILQQAAIAYRGNTGDRPNPEVIVAALLQAEKTGKQQRLTYPPDSLLGLWRLCFATGTRKLRQRGGIRLGPGFYLPRWAPAYLGFNRVTDLGHPHASRTQISNQIQVSGLKLQFTGPAKYLGKRNLLVFDFTQLQIRVGDRPIYTREFRGGQIKTETFDTLPIAKLPFFTFFLITEEWIAARGRGGGLALWIREAEADSAGTDLSNQKLSDPGASLEGGNYV